MNDLRWINRDLMESQQQCQAPQSRILLYGFHFSFALPQVVSTTIARLLQLSNEQKQFLFLPKELNDSRSQLGSLCFSRLPDSTDVACLTNGHLQNANSAQNSYASAVRHPAARTTRFPWVVCSLDGYEAQVSPRSRPFRDRSGSIYLVTRRWVRLQRLLPFRGP